MKKLTKHQVIEILRKEQATLRNRFGVKKIAIFGSFARGNPTLKSDIDIFLELEKPLGLKFFQLGDYLEKKFHRKTDILTPGGLKGIRIKHVADNIRRSIIYV